MGRLVVNVRGGWADPQRRTRLGAWIGAKRRDAYRLREALERSPIPFDYILIDTPPSLDILTANSLVAATEILLPVQCHYLAMRGVRAVMDMAARIQQGFTPSLRLLGVLPTLYRTIPRRTEVPAGVQDGFPSRTFGRSSSTARMAEATIVSAMPCSNMRRTTRPPRLTVPCTGDHQP